MRIFFKIIPCILFLWVGRFVAQPAGQPVQMSSKVILNEAFYNSFFDRMEWSYPLNVFKRSDGRFARTGEGDVKAKDTVHIMHTAKLFSDVQYEHCVRFCEATLRNDTLTLLFHDKSPSTKDNLKIVIYKDLYTSQYWTSYVSDTGDELYTWTTKEQKLVLTTDHFKKGDLVKGSIEFSCLQEEDDETSTEHHPLTIKIKGPFRTIIN